MKKSAFSMKVDNNFLIFAALDSEALQAQRKGSR
jgi:hypothetical protein